MFQDLRAFTLALAKQLLALCGSEMKESSTGVCGLTLWLPKTHIYSWVRHWWVLSLPFLKFYKGKRREWRSKATVNIFWFCLVLEMHSQGTRKCGKQEGGTVTLTWGDRNNPGKLHWGGIFRTKVYRKGGFLQMLIPGDIAWAMGQIDLTGWQMKSLTPSTKLILIPMVTFLPVICKLLLASMCSAYYQHFLSIPILRKVKVGLGLVKVLRISNFVMMPSRDPTKVKFQLR